MFFYIISERTMQFLDILFIQILQFCKLAFQVCDLFTQSWNLRQVNLLLPKPIRVILYLSLDDLLIAQFQNGPQDTVEVLFLFRVDFDKKIQKLIFIDVLRQ